MTHQAVKKALRKKAKCVFGREIFPCCLISPAPRPFERN